MPVRALLLAIGCCLIAAASAGSNVRSLAERIELLDWSDPSRAVRLIDAAAIPAERRLLDVPMLEISGMVYTDMHRDADAAAALADLESLSGRGDAAATAAAHYVRAYALHRHGDYAAAVAELNTVDIDAVGAAAEQYRFLELRGSSLKRQRAGHAAVTALQTALDLAQSLGDDLRSAHAMIELATAHADAGDLDRAAELLAAAQTSAAALGDEALLAAIDAASADVAARRGQPAAARRLVLSALEHAKRSESDQSLALAYVDLGASYLRTREWRESLKSLQLAAPLVARTGDSGVESALLANQGLALIGLGNVKPGQEILERAIKDALARNDLPDARDMLRAYADALQRAGYLMMALQVYQRHGEVGDRLLASVQANAGREPAAANERESVPGALLPASAAVASAAAGRPHASGELVLTIVLGVAGVGAAMFWAFGRNRQTNERLRQGGERDALTGLWTRRHFNEKVLSRDAKRAFNGCVLMADLDHFKRINHALGHRAGDAVLAAVGRRFVDAVRGSDVLVRWEGEAFLIVLDGATPDEANRTAELMLQTVRGNPVPLDGTAIDCTLSIGYACFPLAGATTDIALTGAINLVERALQEAKRRGRDRACLISAVNVATKRTANPGGGGGSSGGGDFDATAAERNIELKEMGVAA